MPDIKTDIISVAVTGGASVIAILIAFFKAKIHDWAKKKIESIFAAKSFNKEDAARGRRINELLIELRVTTNADRSFIFKFHNGEYFSIKDPVWKLTCTNETVKVGISYEIHKLRNILVSSVIDFITPIFSPEEGVKGFVIVDHNKVGCDPVCEITKNIILCKVDEMEDSSSKALLMEQGVKQSVVVGLKSRDQILGFIGLDYCSDVELELSIVIPKLCQTSSSIGFVTYGKEKYSNR